MTLTVSVALGTYNGSQFIEAQVRSILCQSMLPRELVVSDDGSTDDTLARIRSTFAECPNSPVALRILTVDGRLGVTKNFERAVAACRSDLIALCDQDDLWHPDRISSAVPSFDKDPSLLLQHSDARLVDSLGVPLPFSLGEALRISSADRSAIAGDQPFETYLRRNLATGATVLFRSSLRDSAMPFPIEWVHDEWLTILASAFGHVQLLDRELIDYRQHGGNQIGARRPTMSYRIARMLEPRGSRYRNLSARARILDERLAQLPVSKEVRALAGSKAGFEGVRAALPDGRLRRVPTIYREWMAGSYRAYSSQGNLDVLRDVLQPA